MNPLKRALTTVAATATLAAGLSVVGIAPAWAGTSTCVGEAIAYNDDGSVLLTLSQTTTSISTLRHDSPVKVYAGSAPYTVNIVSNSSIDVEATNKAYDLGGGRYVRGQSDISVKLSSQQAQVPLHLTIPMTPLVRDQATSLVASGSITFTPPAVPQMVSFKTPDQNYYAETTFYKDAAGTIKKTYTRPLCDPAAEDTILGPGGATAIRVVSRSTTTAGAIPARMPSNATASVPVTTSVDAGTVSGKVRLVVDGVAGELRSLSGGSTTLTLAGLAEGTHRVRAEFVPNDPNLYEGSSSAEQVIDILPPAIATQTTLSLARTSVGSSEPVAATATVTSASGSPEGAVEFFANGTQVASVPLSSGRALASITGLAPGAAYDITARFAPTAPLQYAASESGVATVIVRAPSTPTVTSVVLNKNPASSTDLLTATATVAVAPGSSSTATIAGTVQFLIDGVQQGSPASVTSAGTATKTLGRVSVAGAHVLTAEFSPANPADFEPSSGTSDFTITAPGTPTTTSLTLSRTVATSADTVVATVDVTRSGGTPVGSVDVFVDGVKAASKALTSGSATVDLPALDAGTRSVHAVFVPADANVDQASQSAISTVTVSAVTSSTALELSPTTTSAGYDVTAVATVTTSAGSPKGTVEFFVDGARAATATVDATGRASASLPQPVEGTFTVKATFVPSQPAQQKGSTSAEQDLVVTAPVQAIATTTSASLVETVVTVNDNAVVRATVAAVDAPTASPRGRVEVLVDGQAVSAALDEATGRATVQLPKLALGSYTFSARFVPDNAQVFTPSESSGMALTVQRSAAVTSTSLVVTPTAAAFGDDVVATALVGSDRGTPLGQVAFRVDDQPEQLVALDGMSAELTFSGLAAGDHVVTARFVPADRLVFAASSATDVAVTVFAEPTIGTATGVVVTPSSVTENEAAAAVVGVTPQQAWPAGGAVGSVEVVLTDPNGTVEVLSPVALDAATSSAVVDLSGHTYLTGEFRVVARYVPPASSRYGASTSPSRTLTVSPAPVGMDTTVTALTLSPASVTEGDDAFAVAAVSWRGGVPEGAVQFRIDGVDHGTPVPLVDGTAKVQLPTALPADKAALPFTVVAVFSPDPARVGEMAPSTSDPKVLRVTKADPTPTLTVLGLTPEQLVEGSDGAAVAVVHAQAGSPAGQVVFSVDGVDQEPVDWVAGTTTEVSLPLAGLAQGTYLVGARFVPTTAAEFGESTAVNALLTVVAPPPAVSPTTTALVLSKSAAYADELVSGQVVVTADDGRTPTGEVVVSVAGQVLRAALVDGRATISIPALTAGSHAVTAAYEPTGRFEPSTSAATTLSVTQRPASVGRATTTSIVLGAGSPNLGSSIPVTVKVEGATGGNVRVSTGWTSLTAPLVNGAATVSLPLMVGGTSTITAVYLPSSDAVQSSSATASITVLKALTSVKLTGKYLRAKRGVQIKGVARATGGVTFCTGTMRITVIAKGRKVFTTKTPLSCSGTLKRRVSPLPKARKYVVKAAYLGSSTTLPSSTRITVKAK